MMIDTGNSRSVLASWAEAFYVETLLGYLALFIGTLLGGYHGFAKLKARLKRKP